MTAAIKRSELFDLSIIKIPVTYRDQSVEARNLKETKAEKIRWRRRYGKDLSKYAKKKAD